MLVILIFKHEYDCIWQLKLNSWVRMRVMENSEVEPYIFVLIFVDHLVHLSYCSHTEELTRLHGWTQFCCSHICETLLCNFLFWSVKSYSIPSYKLYRVRINIHFTGKFCYDRIDSIDTCVGVTHQLKFIFEFIY